MQNENLYKVNTDIIIVLEIAKDVGWNDISSLSIKRILYLSAVLFRFAHRNDINPFEEDYEFIVSLTGPDSLIINKSLLFLEKDFYITRTKNGKSFSLGTNKVSSIDLTPNYSVKFSWIETIIYILATYGEDKIYDFIFRDPEYQSSYDSNSITSININTDNETVKLLNQFKLEFEKYIKGQSSNIESPNTYIKLYFEYIFKNIVKGSAI
jgi:hypothetical protein